MNRIYLDHAATTPMHPEVLAEMVKVMTTEFGNPSSIHHFGREARKILDATRDELAKSIGTKANNILFTSGGTESDNLAVIGYAEQNRAKGQHIITTQVEHHAVLHSCMELEKRGFEVTYLPVDENGYVNMKTFDDALREDTILVTIMYGNNEVGTIQPITEIGQRLAEHQAVFHTDAVQAYGIENLDVEEMKVDMLSVSAHKMNGPKGIGFVYIRDGIKLARQLFGGEQERKRRAGTENVAAIAGFRKAVQLSQIDLDTKRIFYRDLKNRFIKRLEDSEIHFQLNGLLDYTMPHILNLSFPGTNVEAMLVNLDLAGIAASSGSACTAGSIDPSHVLVAMFGKESERLTNSIRFSFGLHNTQEQIDKAAEDTAKIVQRLTKNNGA
ncbi:MULTISPECIES: cysteine desulfurase family protein [Mesobacillus]|uniref:cysteine desulfurase n=2 Tax=Mesobacillus TaxID=2675231 RepID=A0A0D6Z691_9BACI|nr:MULTISPECIES: cysteine desulfurase family protein [Mesobacillus]KIY21112.1 cysteine desulfurase [Mesobacillus subterraneus]MDQ0414521.1 cysteine desulfurase [Mesobacillus stamsii]